MKKLLAALFIASALAVASLGLVSAADHSDNSGPAYANPPHCQVPSTPQWHPCS